MATTREAILEAALRGFGEKGFEATGIREIAAGAGSNVASISYHFGGKEGLRAACAEHIVALMGAVLAAARSERAAARDPGGGRGDPGRARPEPRPLPPPRPRRGRWSRAS